MFKRMYGCLRLSPTIHHLGVGQGRNILSGSTSETFHNRGGDINKDRDKKRCRQQKDKDKYRDKYKDRDK